MNVALWIVQTLLALLFVFAGGMKLVTPIEEMTKQIAMPGSFLRFIGVAELLGGLGLLLPGLTGIKPGLTPLAAAGLIVIMIGAVGLTFSVGGVSMAATPLITGVFLVFVAWGRWRRLPHPERVG